MTDAREDLIPRLAADPCLAHAVLFAHRHPHATPAFHKEIIQDWHGPSRNVLTMAFRGAAKSTLAEEAIIVKACLQKFKNCLIIGENYERACDRLRSIKREFETNVLLEGLFGNLMGPVWHESKVELSSGVVIQCAGQGQAVRGTKHIDVRPDFLFVDDLESKENTATKEARRKLSSWVYSDLFPALDPKSSRRVAATPLDPEAWAVKLTQDKEWKHGLYPIEHVDDEGVRRPTWPDRFPLEWIDRQKHEHFRAGRSIEWEQEFMCRAVDPGSRVFLPEYIRCEPTTRTWHPVFAAYDPARTVSKTSASTGRVVASWAGVGTKLIVWEASAPMWMPDAITEDIFDVDARYSPVKIGVEQDGLHEFLMQPLRAAMAARGRLLPIEPLKAPKGKLDFIKSLQPFFKAGEVVFAGSAPEPFQEMIDQLMSFPTGRIDAPNALAYLLTMRPGVPVYENFSQGNICAPLAILPRTPLFLCLNAGVGCTSAVLVEIIDGRLAVHADWVREGDPGAVLPGILLEARPLAARAFTCYAPKALFGYDTSGMKAAARRETLELRRGGEETDGREVIRSLAGRDIRGVSAFRVSVDAAWTLRAFAGGYARKPGATAPAEGVYRVLCEGLEAWAATLRGGHDSDEKLNWQTGQNGRQYISARA
jgi:hypothetical protein